MERYVWIPPSEAGEYCPLEVIYKPDEVERMDFWQRILDCRVLETEAVEDSNFVALFDGEAFFDRDLNFKASRLLKGMDSVEEVQAWGYYGPVVVARRRLDDAGEAYLGELEEADVAMLKKGRLKA